MKMKSDIIELTDGSYTYVFRFTFLLSESSLLVFVLVEQVVSSGGFKGLRYDCSYWRHCIVLYLIWLCSSAVCPHLLLGVLVDP